jgi:hypothetical protein
MALPAVQSELGAKRCATWAEWYAHVSKAIYDQFALSDVCPGSAKVHVNVFSSNDIDAAVVDFEPAPDVIRNPQAEARFREIALQSVTCLNRCPILQFPYTSHKTRTSFDMEFARAVGAKSGCHILPTQDLEK